MCVAWPPAPRACMRCKPSPPIDFLNQKIKQVIAMPINLQIHLDNRPAGEATASNFRLVTSETPALTEGQVLVRHHYLSLDPYMRGRMNDAKSYTAPQALHEVMG